MQNDSPFQIDSYIPYDDFSISKERVVFNAKEWSLPKLVEHVDQLQSIEELTINAPSYDDESYKKIEYIMNNSTLKALEIHFCGGTAGRSMTPEQSLTLAKCLSSHNTLKKFILYDIIIAYITDARTIEILAKGINGSNLEFVGFYNLHEYILDALYDALSTNEILRRLNLGGSKGFGSRLDSFILTSKITQLRIRTPFKNDRVLSLCNILKTTTTLELFELNITKWPENFTEICNAIAENKSLKTLIIESKLLKTDSSQLTLMMSAVKNHPTIQTFNIGEINSEGLNIIANNLLQNDSNNKLRTLHINRPAYDVYPATKFLQFNHWLFFCEKLATNTTLKHLFLGNISLRDCGQTDHPAFAKALIQNTTLLTLDIYPNSLVNYQGLMDLLQNNRKLTKIAWKGSYVGQDLIKLSEAICHNESLTSLDLSEMLYHMKEQNTLGDFFSALITKNTSLKELKCSKIFKGIRRIPIYVKQILPSLKYNTSLISLDLISESIRIDQDHSKILADVFSVNKSLLKLNPGAIAHHNNTYLKRNREYRLDAVILWHNILRDERHLLPREIWLQILQQVSLFSLVIEKYNKIH